MPPRCAVPCPRAVLRPILPSLDGIWISDTMLVHAIQRYHRVSIACNRHLSSSPGPLESRRRLGKRHMTNIMPESHASPPPWSIEPPWQLGEWQWEAPTTAEDRKLDRRKLSVPRIMDRVLGWLENYDDTPTTHSPPKAEATPLTRVQQSVASIRQQIKDMGQIDDTSKVVALCHGFQQDLEEMIRVQIVTSDDLRLAFNLFDSDMKKLFHNTPYLDRLVASIGTGIVKAVSSSRSTTRHDAYGAEFWLSLIKDVCRLTPQRETFKLFALCVDSLPRTHFDLLCPDDLFLMTKSFVAHQANSGRARPSSVLEFSRGLKRITPLHTEQLWERLVTFLRDLPQDQQQQRFHGTLVLAHDRNASADEFLQVSREICWEGRWSLDEAFSLLRGRLWALRCVRQSDVGWLFRQAADPQGWATLVLCAWRAPDDVKQKALAEMCYVSGKLGCFDTMVEALASEIPQRSDVLQEVAIASQDYKLALQLWETVHSGRNKSKRAPFGRWDWRAWSPYVEQMIKDAELDQDLVWKVLDLKQPCSTRRYEDRAPGSINSKTQLLDMMTQWYLEAPHLSDRQTLRRIQNCINHHQRISSHVSKAAMGNLARVILRDMEKGQFGRTSRLDYLVSLIRKYMGEQEAEAALGQIRGWRWTIDQKGRRVLHGEAQHREFRSAVGQDVSETVKETATRAALEEEAQEVQQLDRFAQMQLLRREAA